MHSQKTLADFWHPRRRLTDLLLILNVGAFGLQYYSKGALLNWGVKVLSCKPGCTSNWQPSCAAGARISTSGHHGVSLTCREVCLQMNPLIAQGQWYRLVSCTFLHANVLHLFTNCQVSSAQL